MNEADVPTVMHSMVDRHITKKQEDRQRLSKKTTFLEAMEIRHQAMVQTSNIIKGGTILQTFGSETEKSIIYRSCSSINDWSSNSSCSGSASNMGMANHLVQQMLRNGQIDKAAEDRERGIPPKMPLSLMIIVIVSVGAHSKISNRSCH